MSTEELTKSSKSGENREHFGSRLAFYFAAVGSAVGFGNVWRFPTLVYSYGGGAFFIPYILALCFIGIPVLYLEIGLGQFYQRGDVSVFSVCHKRMRGVGVCSVACGFITLTYYSMLLAWTTRALFESGLDSSPWNGDNVTSDDAMGYFLGEVIGTKTLNKEDGNRPTRLVGKNVGVSALIALFIFICLSRNMKAVGKITYVTMGLPIIFLFMFLFLGISLEGSGVGIKAYIGQWDMSVLTERGDVWSTAVSQIFFSLSITVGIMTAYGSHMPRDEPALLNTVVIAVANSTFSFIAGFAVFATIGHQAHLLGVPIEKVKNTDGFGLVFGTWPLILSNLSGGIHWTRLLFVFLILLGIDSAFSMQEALMTVIQDVTMFKETPKWKVAGCVTITYWLFSLMYATDAGLNYLDVIDFYINFLLLFIGFTETFSLGWIYEIESQLDKFGPGIVFTYMFANFGAVAFASGFWFGLGTVWSGFVALVLFYGAGMVATVVLLNNKSFDEPLKTTLYDLAFGNILLFKKRAEPFIKTVPYLWCILIKQFIPHVLLLLFVNLARSETKKGKPKFGHYGDYVMLPFQILGILTFVFTALLFLIGVFSPDVYEVLDSYKPVEEEDEAEKPAFPVESIEKVEA